MSNKRSGSLFNAVKRRDWDKARALLQRNDVCGLVEYTNAGNENVVHAAACIYHFALPTDIVRAMVDSASARALLTQDGEGHTPLHCAVARSPSEDMITALLEACPRAASITGKWGETPLHLAISKNRSSNIVRRLLAVNPAAATTTNRSGDTPLRWFFRWNAPLRTSLDYVQIVVLQNEMGKGIRIKELYQTFLLLFQAASHGSIEDNTESTPFRPLTAAITDPRCPWSFVNLILKLDPKQASEWDREGNLPIHIAAAASSSFDGELHKCQNCKCRIQTSSWYQHWREWYIIHCQTCFQKNGCEARRDNFNLIHSVNKIPAVIGSLLSANSNFAKIPDREGRLPFHIAIENETLLQQQHLETMIQAAPEAINTITIKTHLYPFMLGAVTFKVKNKLNKTKQREQFLRKFTTCYALLMENPVLVKSGIPVRGYKRSQDGDE